ncbi:DUF6514 family protein [Clostridium sp.]|uniref:DUF6514 family protein n=1 Tax=Clostridium sp. TaxID=1506 RepID=UPI002628B4EF|nr:DUF6514 family protein [Clostridium sp.]
MLIVKSLIDYEKKEDKTKMVYNYRLIKEEYLTGQAYGIEVERQDFMEDILVKIERAEIRRISNIKEKVQDLLEIIHKNKVSPIHLVDILGEYVDNYVADFN